MRQLGLALINFSSTKHHFPNAGTFHDDPALHGGDPAKSTIYASIVDPGKLSDGGVSWLHSWVVDILPYLDQTDLANAWDKTVPYWWPTEMISGQPSNDRLSNTRLGILRCPDDPKVTTGRGNLSYVVNGGFTRWPAIPVGWAGSSLEGESRNGGIRQWMPPGRPWQETQAIGKKLGVMFLGTETGDQPWDITTAPADLSDGASQTLLIAENTLAGFSTGNRHSGGRATNWACPLPNFVMFVGSDNVCASKVSPNDCLGGQLAPLSSRRDGLGWARTSRLGTYENINFGQKLTVEGSFPFANSGHQGGGNFVFCDGAVRFLSESIDGTVYAKLITPAGGRLPGSLTQGPFAGVFE
jgi:prepilin-type processing-associated H-X9-DG protein